MQMTGLVERLDGLLSLPYAAVTLTAHQGALAELVSQLRPFWPHVRRAVLEREDGMRYVHYWQPSEAPGGELQLYLEPSPRGDSWVCVILDNHTLEPTFVATGADLTACVGSVLAAIAVGLGSRGLLPNGAISAA